MEQMQSTLVEPEHATAAGVIERIATLTTATAMVAYGLSRRNVPGVFLAAAATPLAYRAFSGNWPRFTNGRSSAQDTRTALAGDRGVHVREAISLEKPIDEVYRFWRRLENLPRFMGYLERVTEIDHRRSHWVARGPGGMHVDWDAEIINDVPNEVIAWRTLPGADVMSAGSVNFDTVRNGRSTRVSVRLQYAPPGGRAGALAATLFGREPSQTVREDLRRLKQVLEAGELARSSAQA
jgi:uncharacterized membrane protein